jgi:hypothetical protein
VVLHASVSDSQGKLLSTLDRDAFRVFETGAPQEIKEVYFGVISRGPEAEFLKNAVVDIGFDVRKPVEVVPMDDAKVKSGADHN